MSDCTAEPITTLLTITRDGADPLVIGPDCDGEAGLYFSDLLRPAFVLQYDSTGPSPWTKGSGVLLNAQEGNSDVTGIIVAYGPDRAAVDAQRAILTAAVYQADFQVSITVGELVEGPWWAWPTIPQLADKVTPRRAGLLADALTVSIPVEPLGAP